MKRIALITILIIFIVTVGIISAEPAQQTKNTIDYPLPICNFLPFIDGPVGIWPPRENQLNNVLILNEIPPCLQVTPVVPSTSTPVVFPTDEPGGCDTCVTGTKILICHNSELQQKTIYISCSAWPAHQSHGDYCGACK